ncbi:hypothetical protein F4X10_18455 [Candidatus Poribacteria bacterium]|nr:hypothetical protein [Candidatus Poribacteria bacterium]
MTDDQRRDAELVRCILCGDETAFDALYKRHKSRLYGFIVNKIDDRRDAEELTNDTFLKAEEHLHTLQEPEKVLNWMFSIASQLIAGWHRRHKNPVRRKVTPTFTRLKVKPRRLLLSIRLPRNTQ